ncbi:MAG: hypothetical protein R3F48_05840 [Candidatus Zixiibacteriota bacterium]
MGRLRIQITANKGSKLPHKRRLIEGLENHEYGGRVVRYQENKTTGICNIEYRVPKRPPKAELHARIAASLEMRRGKFDKFWKIEFRDA